MVLKGCSLEDMREWNKKGELVGIVSGRVDFAVDWQCET
jgi:hypothetical protein